MLPGTTSHRASSHLPAPTSRQRVLGRAVQLQTPLSFPTGAGLVPGAAHSRLLGGWQRAAADGTSLLPFPDFSPTQASEGPTSRTLTAVVQDGESKLLGHRLKGLVLVESSILHLLPAAPP